MVAIQDTPSFGTLLSRYRHAAGLSRDALAERAGMSAAAIAALERGRRAAPYRETVQRLVGALDLPAEEMRLLEAAVDRHRRPAPAAPAPTAGQTQPLPSRTPLARLIGRERELADLIGLLQREEVRLVTLTGPAGVGKTRLALAVVQGGGDTVPVLGVVDLSDVRDPGLVVAAAAEQLGLLDPGSAPLQRLERAVGDRTGLLVLDNFEQVLAAAVELLPLLAGAPGLKLLVTSRAPLGLRPEVVFALAPLDLPDPRHLPPLDELAHVPAVALFVERAGAHAPGFALREDSAGAVAELCVHLDGLPLALELAAARARLLSPAMILERLGASLSLLRWDARDLPERQQTLSAAIGWSYDLLTPAEQALLRRLGVFAGGFSLAAAEALRDDRWSQDLDVVDALEALVSNSLVVSEDEGAGQRRYRLLDSIRAFALDQLTRHDERDAACRAHAAYCVQFAERATAAVNGPHQRSWLLQLEREQENLRAAMQWLAEHPEGALELRLAIAAAFFWSLRGNANEGRRRLEGALARALDAPPQARTRALIQLGETLSWQGAVEEARGRLHEALDLARAQCDTAGTGRALVALGWCDVVTGAPAQGSGLLEQGLAAAQAAHDTWTAGFACVYLGSAVRAQGQPQRAAAALEAALTAARAIGNEWMTALTLMALGNAYLDTGDVSHAAGCLRESLLLSGPLQDPWLLDLTSQRTVLLGSGRLDDALLVATLGALDTLHQTRGLALTPEAPLVQRLTADLRQRLGADRFTTAWERGRACSYAQTEALTRQLLELLPAAAAGRPRPAAVEDAGPAAPLSPREREVLALIAEGLTNRQIAGRLYVVERTAKGYVTAVFNKLGVSNRAQAVAVAAERGLL
jgi:predicted ATPase/DNA-binding CsgD family transcriptional regulator